MTRAIRTVALVGFLATCSHGADHPPAGATPAFPRRVDIGGFSLEIACWGQGTPTVVLDAGYDASGITEFGDFATLVDGVTRVCTYDRAGIGSSGFRPAAEAQPDMGLQADELHTLLTRAGIQGPYVIMAHSYSGFIARLFAQRYPDDTAGLILEDASNEWEEPIYRRLHAGPWIDGGVHMDIAATVRELGEADRPGDLGELPIVVVSAQIIKDRWLKTVPDRERSFQARLAALSRNSMHVEAEHTGHFIHDEQPQLMLQAVKAVVDAVRSGRPLEACSAAFAGIAAARCLT